MWEIVCSLSPRYISLAIVNNFTCFCWDHCLQDYGWWEVLLELNLQSVSVMDEQVVTSQAQEDCVATRILKLH